MIAGRLEKMITRRTNKIKKTFESNELYWKRRPSEIRGYQRTLYITTEKGDYIRVDYNLKEKRVRLYLEDGEEGGNPYYSVISDGKISIERNATTGRVFSLFEKFIKRSDIISAIPNKEILKLINNNYGIGAENKQKPLFTGQKKVKHNDLRMSLEKTRLKYFISEGDANSIYKIKEAPVSIKQKRERYQPIDFLDLLIGIFLCITVFVYNNNYIILGVLSAFLGIIIGLVDIFYRVRQPFFSKMIFFIIIGIFSYIYGYYIL